MSVFHATRITTQRCASLNHSSKPVSTTSPQMWSSVGSRLAAKRSLSLCTNYWTRSGLMCSLKGKAIAILKRLSPGVSKTSIASMTSWIRDSASLSTHRMKIGRLMRSLVTSRRLIPQQTHSAKKLNRLRFPAWKIIRHEVAASTFQLLTWNRRIKSWEMGEILHAFKNRLTRPRCTRQLSSTAPF